MTARRAVYAVLVVLAFCVWVFGLCACWHIFWFLVDTLIDLDARGGTVAWCALVPVFVLHMIAILLWGSCVNLFQPVFIVDFARRFDQIGRRES